jgi:hypothetical protein
MKVSWVVVVFRVVMPCNLLGDQQHFGGTCNALPDDGGDAFFLNIGNHGKTFQDHVTVIDD